MAMQLMRSHEARLAELARDIVGAARLRRDFVLGSGSRRRYCFDKYLFETKPSILRRGAALLADLVPPQTDRIAGPELGALGLATALSLEVGLPFVIARKAAKRASCGASGMVVEDLLSTGAPAIQAPRDACGTRSLADKPVFSPSRSRPDFS